MPLNIVLQARGAFLQLIPIYEVICTMPLGLGRVCDFPSGRTVAVAEEVSLSRSGRGVHVSVVVLHPSDLYRPRLTDRPFPKQ
jgi:hypothetical protein